jgi:hemolysin activation/secretion protein
LRFAWSSDSLPPVEQIYMGGMLPEERYKDLDIYNSVPFVGMMTRKLPGDIMAIAHIDYRLTIKKGIYLTTIMDWGYIWKLKNYTFDSAPDDFLKYAPVGLGMGIALETIAGPLQFTYGRLLHNSTRLNIQSDNQWYLSLGHDF